MAAPHAAPDQRTFSQVIEQLGETGAPKLSIGEMVDAFGERGFGAVMLVIAIINALPLPPGATTVLGAPLLLLSAQLAARSDHIWLPRWATKASVDRQAYRSASLKVIRPIRRLEALSRPRLAFLTSDISEMAIGVVCVLLCLVLVLPIPLGNMAPSLTIAIFSLGLMQRDGVMVIIGWVGAIASFALLTLVWTAVVAFGQNALSWVGGLF